MKMIKYPLALLTLFLFGSCSDDGNTVLPIEQSFLEQNKTLATQVKTTYANIVLASYQDTLYEAIELQNTINRFVENPTDQGLLRAKQAWLNAREPYGQTEAYRFANGPIDNESLTLSGPEGLLNAWPLDESYLDDVTHSQESNTNIINDPINFPTISTATLENLNEAGGERNVAVGYHAIEFLLWGQDTTIPTNGTIGTTGGNRPHTDFVDNGTLNNQDRRRSYLAACAELLVDHLRDLVNEWDTSGDNYRSTFLAFSNEEAIQNILLGMAVFVGPELGRERVFVALSESSQEDEHSCFSDNTHRDLRLNFLGVRNLYDGSYKKLDGSIISSPSIRDLATALTGNETTIATTLSRLFNEANASIEATGIPFDFAIFDTNSRQDIETASTDLLEVGTQLGLLSAAFGINIGTVELPE